METSCRVSAPKGRSCSDLSSTTTCLCTQKIWESGSVGGADCRCSAKSGSAHDTATPHTKQYGTQIRQDALACTAAVVTKIMVQHTSKKRAHVQKKRALLALHKQSQERLCIFFFFFSKHVLNHEAKKMTNTGTDKLPFHADPPRLCRTCDGCYRPLILCCET